MNVGAGKQQEPETCDTFDPFFAATTWHNQIYAAWTLVQLLCRMLFRFPLDFRLSNSLAGLLPILVAY